MLIDSLSKIDLYELSSDINAYFQNKVISQNALNKLTVNIPYLLNGYMPVVEHILRDLYYIYDSKPFSIINFFKIVIPYMQLNELFGYLTKRNDLMYMYLIQSDINKIKLMR